jgi:hypothetical protein
MDLLVARDVFAGAEQHPPPWIGSERTPQIEHSSQSGAISGWIKNIDLTTR